MQRVSSVSPVNTVGSSANNTKAASVAGGTAGAIIGETIGGIGVAIGGGAIGIPALAVLGTCAVIGGVAAAMFSDELSKDDGKPSPQSTLKIKSRAQGKTYTRASGPIRKSGFAAWSASVEQQAKQPTQPSEIDDLRNGRF